MKYSILILLSLFFAFSGFASTNVKFGKFSKQELELTQVPYDPEAEVAILYSSGNMQYIGSGTFKFTKHVRLKILKESGKKEADQAYPVYVKNRFEKFQRLKAHTAQHENGKVVLVPLSKKEQFVTDENEVYSLVRFTFPDVKVGSILEYIIEIESQSIEHLEEWEFNNQFPTLTSHFSVAFPPSLTYRFLLQGEKITTKYQGKLDIYEWYLNDLVGLKDEPFVYQKRDFTDKILFQLASYQTMKQDVGISGKRLETVSVNSTWDEFTKSYMNYSKVKSYYKFSQVPAGIKSHCIELWNKNEPQLAIKEIMQFLRANFAWNGYIGYYPSEEFGTLLNKKTGSLGDLNLLLFAVLSDLGLECYPAITASRSKGRILPNLTFSSRFNYIMVHWVWKEQGYFLDMLNNGPEPFEIPLHQLNSCAVIVKEKDSELKALIKNKISKNTMLATLEIRKGKEMELMVQQVLGGYFKNDIFKRLDEKDPNEKLSINLKSFLEANGEIVLDVADQKMIPGQDFVMKWKLKEQEVIAINQNEFAIRAFPFDLFSKNPFTADYRTFPIEFPYSFHHQYILNINYDPAEVQIGFVPENQAITLNGDMHRFTFISSQNPGQLMIKIDFINNQFAIPQSSYKELQQFYTSLSNKLSEMLEIKWL